MTRPHQIEESLKSLRLSGMLETLDARLAQAKAGELGHLELLQVLCEDEIARREAAGLANRLAAARFEKACTIEEFDFSYNTKVPVAQIRDLATLRFVDSGEGVIIHGPVGVGKTHIAQALGHGACRRGHHVIFTKTSRLLAELGGGHADRTWAQRLRRLAKPAVLILDDFAMRDFSVAQADDLYELVTERAGKATIFTANRMAQDWYGLFPNPVVAESILDRIVNTAHHVHMDGKSYRPKNRPNRARTRCRRGTGASGATRSTARHRRKVPPANLPVAVEIAHEPTEDVRPAGRIFSVKLSRGDKTVTVAEGLGRPSAEHLAGEIISILAPSRPRGGTIS